MRHSVLFGAHQAPLFAMGCEIGCVLVDTNFVCVCMLVCLHVCTWMCVCVCACAHSCVLTNVCVRVCLSVSMCGLVCVCTEPTIIIQPSRLFTLFWLCSGMCAYCVACVKAILTSNEKDCYPILIFCSDRLDITLQQWCWFGPHFWSLNTFNGITFGTTSIWFPKT